MYFIKVSWGECVKSLNWSAGILAVNIRAFSTELSGSLASSTMSSSAIILACVSTRASTVSRIYCGDTSGLYFITNSINASADSNIEAKSKDTGK